MTPQMTAAVPSLPHPAFRRFLGYAGPKCRSSLRRCGVVRVGELDGAQIDDLRQLQVALSKAVQAEDYATAARLRDEIRELDFAAPAAAAVAQVKHQLQEATAQQRFQEAAWLRNRLLSLLLDRLRDQQLPALPPPEPECPSICSTTVTNDVRVTVRSYYLPRQSCPSGDIYLFAYSVTVTNEGRNTVLLKNRHWRITDGQQCTREDGGPSVAGQRPILAPGQSFEYKSACPISTPMGTMEGHFEVWTRSSSSSSEVGEASWAGPFNAIVGRFGLNSTESARVDI